jgi:Icc-related predicted phosphoesterase
MRIHLLSDLHFEFAKMPRTYTPPECDVVVLSGDISAGLPGVMWAVDTFTVPVIYIPGNHEYYVRRPWRDHLAKMKAKVAGTNVHVLHNETVDIDGVRFIGATMWADFDLFGQNFFHQQVAQRGMNDYACIFTDDRGTNFTADESLAEHQFSRQFITDELVKPFEGKKVVCTHHGPTELSVAPRWQNHPLTPAYTSRMANLLLDHGPVLWTHGHVHDTFDYVIGETRVRTNPRGYEGHEINPAYDMHLVLDV